MRTFGSPPRRSALTQATLAALAMLIATPVLAQDTGTPSPTQAEAPADDEDQKEESGETLETVRVTGSLISRQGFDSISPVQIITADVSRTTGQLDTTSILQTSSVASGSTQFSTQFSGFVIEGGNGVQTVGLRGLGANRTLVLLDGRRPGPAGTRGQVGAFDTNVIPNIILQRVEILKDGAGSIYGSDAVGGVVNLITRKDFDGVEVSLETDLPQENGGASWSAAIGTGWNFDNGSVVAAFQHFDQQSLKIGDRDFLKCPQDLVQDANGNSIDRVDRSITAGTSLGGCNNLYANTVIAGAVRYIPSPDGVTIGPLAGYRPRRNANATATSPAFYEDVLDFDFFEGQDVFSALERTSLFAAADFSFGEIDWNGQFLYTSRETQSRRYRQFFPTVDGALFGRASVLPIMPFRSDQNIDVDFYYVASGFSGGFGSDSSWNWRLDTTYSRSDGDYEVLSIDRDRTGDLGQDRNGGGAPINYFDPRILNGQGIDALQQAVGVWHTGNTVYTQFNATAIVSGDLFELPAGTASAAFGTEFRRTSINDAPSDIERSGGLWGQSSATGTKGKDYVTEIFGEFEAPLLAGIPGIEELKFNASGRVFKYDTVADSDYVWKVGLGWKIIPQLTLRATNGTSYRAPGLYELFLGDQTGFLGQFTVDPCIEWADPQNTNANLRANCAAAGIPGDYDGTGSSATIVTGGGLGVLKPETSKALSAGLVFTPGFANLSASLDYYRIEVNDQIDQLGAGNIAFGCYGLPVFPNAFCDQLTRNPGTADPGAYNITEIRDSFININQQLVRGYDLVVNWEGDFSFGKLEVETQFSKTIEDVVVLFSSAEQSGFDTDNNLGLIGRPKLTGNIRTAYTRGDFTYTWGMRYVDETENFNFVVPATYFGTANPQYDTEAESRLYHSLSVFYRSADWNLLVGVDNVFDRDPPKISGGIGNSRFGNSPAFATQYDIYGRSLFARFQYTF